MKRLWLVRFPAHRETEADNRTNEGSTRDPWVVVGTVGEGGLEV